MCTHSGMFTVFEFLFMYETCAIKLNILLSRVVLPLKQLLVKLLSPLWFGGRKKKKRAQTHTHTRVHVFPTEHSAICEI